jgi:hypothetical protein
MSLEPNPCANIIATHVVLNHLLMKHKIKIRRSLTKVSFKWEVQEISTMSLDRSKVLVSTSKKAVKIEEMMWENEHQRMCALINGTKKNRIKWEFCGILEFDGSERPHLEKCAGQWLLCVEIPKLFFCGTSTVMCETSKTRCWWRRIRIASHFPLIVPGITSAAEKSAPAKFHVR